MPAAIIHDNDDLTLLLEKTDSPVMGQTPPLASVAAITDNESQLESKFEITKLRL